MKRALLLACLLAAFGGKNVSVDVMLILGVASRFKQGARVRGSESLLCTQTHAQKK